MRQQNTKFRPVIEALAAEKPGFTSQDAATALGCNIQQAASALHYYKNLGLLRMKRAKGTNRGRYYLAHCEPKKPEPIVDLPIPAPQVPQPVVNPVKTIPTEPINPNFGEALHRVVSSVATLLAGEIVRLVEPALTKQLHTLAEQIITKAGPIPTPNEPIIPPIIPSTPDSERKKKVVVVGLWNSQKAHIKTEFDKCLDLDFVGPDESYQQLKKTAATADEVLVMTGKINHGHTDALLSVRKGYTRITGLTDLREKLTNIFVAEG